MYETAVYSEVVVVDVRLLARAMPVVVSLPAADDVSASRRQGCSQCWLVFTMEID